MGIIDKMKIKILLLVTFLCLIALTFSKTHKKKLRQMPKEIEDKYKGYEQPEIRGSGNTNRAQHVKGMMLPLPPAAKDRSPLWKDFTRSGYERPFMHGVVVPNGQYQEPKLLVDLISLDPLCPNPILKLELLLLIYQTKPIPELHSIIQREKMLFKLIFLPNLLELSKNLMTPKVLPKNPLELFTEPFTIILVV